MYNVYKINVYFTGGATEDCNSSQTSGYLGVLMFGQMLHGAAGATLYSIGVVFLDENIKTQNSPFYQGKLFNKEMRLLWGQKKSPVTK